MRYIYCFLSFFFLIHNTIVAEEAVFGALIHLTGDYASQGQAFREGVELAQEEINASGGLAGAPIKVIFEDTAYLSVKAASGAKKLINTDKVQGAIISTLTEAKVASPLFERAQIPNIVLWDSAPELEDIGEYAFGIGPWAPASGEKAAEFSRSFFKAKRAALVYSQNEWSENVSKNFVRTFTAAGGTITDQIAVNSSETDFRSLIVKLRGKDPDLLYAPLDMGIIPFFRQIKEMKLNIPVITSDIITEDYLQTESTIFESVYQTLPRTPELEATKQLQIKYQKKYGHPCVQTLFVAWGYDALHVLVKASAAAARKSKAALKDAIYSLPAFEGASGTIKFNAKGSSSTPIGVYQVREKKYVRVG